MNLDIILETANRHTQIDEEMYNTLLKVILTKQLDAGDYILKQGQIASFIILIGEGSAYYYKVDDQGKERVVAFAFEGQLFTDLGSYVTETPSDFYIKALEPTTLFYMNKRDIDQLLASDLRWEHLMRLFMQDALIEIIEERKGASTLTNTERYLKLIEKYPNILQRIPLYLIASFLNITPEGLSKIRRRLAQGKK